MSEPVSHKMSEEEWEIYQDKCFNINKILQHTPLHLLAPIMIKMTVATHLASKGITEEMIGAKQLHDKLIHNISCELMNKTDTFITERN